jgi:signal peptidase II
VNPTEVGMSTSDGTTKERAQARRWKLTSWVYAAAVLVYALDRVSKVLVEHRLAHHAPLDVIPGVLRFTYTTNPGGAFGLFGNAPYLFLAATLVVCGAIVVASFNANSLPLAIGLGLVLGGAVGNLTDRIVRGTGLSGRVVDFIDFRVWPVFNVADSAIVIGAALILVSGLRRAASR